MARADDGEPDFKCPVCGRPWRADGQQWVELMNDEQGLIITKCPMCRRRLVVELDKKTLKITGRVF